MNFKVPMTPVEAAQDHLHRTLERHPVGPPTSLVKRRAINEVTKELRIRRLRQGDHVEAGEIRAAEAAQESIEAIENELQFLVGSR